MIRACKELGLQTVAVYSLADTDCLHVQVSPFSYANSCKQRRLPVPYGQQLESLVCMQLADEAVCIGEAPSSESYLNIPNLLAAAVSRGADAIHPVSPCIMYALLPALRAGHLSSTLKLICCRGMDSCQRTPPLWTSAETMASHSLAPAQTPSAQWATSPRPGTR